jgi:hypothetical protein
MRFILSYVLILFGFLHSETTYCQIVNIENKRIYDDTSGWSGALDVSFSVIQNKNLLYNFNTRSRIQYKTHKHSYFILSDFFYSGGQTVYANSGMGHLRYAYRIKNSGWKWESYTQAQYNQLLNQKLRTLAGTGIRAKIKDTKILKAFLGSSIFYEYEETQPTRTYTNTIRWSNYLSWFINYKHISFSGTTYYQPNIETFSDYRLSGQYTLNSAITKKLRFKLDFNTFFDSRPPQNTRKSVYSFLIGLGYDFGK